MDVLILGGSSLARELATQLHDEGLDVTTSLAGRTLSPRPLPGTVRDGGFGGADGLAQWLSEERPRCVVNAVHSFAAAMSDHAVRACRASDIPLARLERPSWHDLSESAHWNWVTSHDAAAAALADISGPLLLTVGRQATAHYLSLGTRDVTHRVIDPPAQALPTGWHLITARGPYTLEGERELMDAPGHRIAALVTKDSGGSEPDPKLVVAEEIGAVVVIVERPPEPSEVPQLRSIGQAADWVHAALGRPIGWKS